VGRLLATARRRAIDSFRRRSALGERYAMLAAGAGALRVIVRELWQATAGVGYVTNAPERVAT
jgi:hypothetical protein